MNSETHIKYDLDIEGMSCSSCVLKVENTIANIEGVNDVNVNFATEKATVITKENVSRNEIVSALNGAGYEVAEKEYDYEIEGMSCASCVGRIERAILKVPGVSSVNVNLATDSAKVNGYIDSEDVISSITLAGYSAIEKNNAITAREEGADKKQMELNKVKKDFVISLLLTAPLFIVEMGSHFSSAFHHFISNSIDQTANWYVQLLIASLVMLGPGFRFFRQGIPALLKRRPDMNSLVALGTFSAWIYSAVATIAPQLLPIGTANVYFEAVAVIVTLILLGRYLEFKAKIQTNSAIKTLVDLQPKFANVTRGGKTVEIAIDEIRVGDLVEVRPGEQIPLDSVVVEGISYVDESMITGEPIPVLKGIDDSLVGGTINQKGALTIKVSALSKDSALSRIIKMVEYAQGTKLPIQAYIDKVTAWFVPAIIGLSFMTFLVWFALGPSPAISFAMVNAVAVLIVACPCAMGLATPTSIMVGTGRAAKMGVLFRDGEALQMLQDVNVVAFDKTGTLTEGKPKVTDVITRPDYTQTELFSIMASVEAKSEHPIAGAILEEAEKRNLNLIGVEQFSSITGLGVRAKVENQVVEIGSNRYMRNLKYDIQYFESAYSKLSGEGKSPIYVAVESEVVGVVCVADPIKEEAVEVVKQLHSKGLKVAMITGDSELTAKFVAKELNIDYVESEVLPEGKVNAIMSLQNNFGKLAFVGDGINDAPALATADVGIAMGTGTDVAIESAAVVLMSGRLDGVQNAISLSKATITNIKQNLFWAFAYNTALIPIAAGAMFPTTGLLLSPVFAAGAMALSSVFVVGNSLRLNFIRM